MGLLLRVLLVVHEGAFWTVHDSIVLAVTSATETPTGEFSDKAFSESALTVPSKNHPVV